MAEVNTGGGGGGKGGKVRSKKSSTKIDMTPMVDLAFLLLTFFMLATTFNKPQTMELVMPEKPKPDDKPPKVNSNNVLNIILANNNKIVWYIGLENPQAQKTDYSAKGIREVLLREKANPKLVVLIKADEKATYKNVVDILDEMTISTVRSYALVDITDSDKELLKTQQL